MRTGFEDKPWWVGALLGVVLGAVIYGVGLYFVLEPKNQLVACRQRSPRPG